MQVFLGDIVTITREEAFITGRVNGVKLDKGQLESVSFECIDIWFYMYQGWKFIDIKEEDEDDVD